MPTHDRTTFCADVITGMDLAVTVKIDVNPNRVVSSIVEPLAPQRELDLQGIPRPVRDLPNHLLREDLRGGVGAADVLESNANRRAGEGSHI